MKKFDPAKSIALASVALLSTVSAAAAQNLTVTIYGGSWGDAITKCITEPFAAETGITVTPEPGTSSVTLAKLKQQRDAPAIDVAWMDGGVSELAEADGLVAALDPAELPNIAGMFDQAVYKNADGEIFALGTGFYSLGLVYNTDEISEPPTSWEDLWSPDYARLVTVPSPSNAMGAAFFALVNKMEGGEAGDYGPGAAKMKALDVSSYFDASGNASNAFESGEVIIGAHYASAAWAIADKGLPIGYAIPSEGAPSGDIRLHVAEGTPNAEAAKKFVNFAVGKEPAACMVNTLYVGPATKGVEVSDEARQRLPWGADGSIENLAITDWVEVNANREKITEIFNREVAGGR
ncbi:ABC transporter substrate-binding protein [Acuticoccus kandeliae]|uniref:ABC transporter substrate-binding protein n=1 Tax=Acuticoccus kandeliae TaxID=2073160 RepID=UPI000D3EA791|nr:ABC transporter substrate-binding protein [Acuticoccus kandeliae]